MKLSAGGKSAAEFFYIPIVLGYISGYFHDTDERLRKLAANV
jgi:hypothetical protein